ncbi:hypothetical protein C0Q70_12417 [Pomacea canaliculata]|uniref:Uncharacterized protein n=1 Tax=Pomacea canaliculata TaxID=400727 RepID=A0A2T7P1G5_POMCA|nr:hypothetical protein C0Q70_12417 [Pomacea canaliculata]
MLQEVLSGEPVGAGWMLFFLGVVVLRTTCPCPPFQSATTFATRVQVRFGVLLASIPLPSSCSHHGFRGDLTVR